MEGGLNGNTRHRLGLKNRFRLTRSPVVGWVLVGSYYPRTTSSVRV